MFDLNVVFSFSCISIFNNRDYFLNNSFHLDYFWNFYNFLYNLLNNMWNLDYFFHYCLDWNVFFLNYSDLMILFLNVIHYFFHLYYFINLYYFFHDFLYLFDNWFLNNYLNRLFNNCWHFHHLLYHISQWDYFFYFLIYKLRHF